MRSVIAAVVCAILGAAVIGCVGFPDHPATFRPDCAAFVAGADAADDGVRRAIAAHGPTAVYVCDGAWRPEPMTSLPEGSLRRLRFVQIVRLPGGAAFPMPGTPEWETMIEALSPDGRTWKIALTDRNPLLPNVAKDGFDLIEHLGRQGVTLAISGDGHGYARSVPTGPHADAAVRYISLGGGAAAPDASPALVLAFAGAHGAVLTATKDRLTWTVYDAKGRVRDSLILRKDAPAAQSHTATELQALERDARPAVESPPAQ